MHNAKNIIFVLAASLLSITIISCSKSSDTQKVNDAAEVAVQAPPPPPKQLPPPGEPGPFLLQIQDRMPNHVFGSAATADYFAIAVQADARDIAWCPKTQLPVCYKGNAYVTSRMNPNEPKLIELYESDTQSGSRIDDVAATSDRFAFAIVEGIYAGDSRAVSIGIVSQTGSVERFISLDQPDSEILQVALTATETDVVSCFATLPGADGNSKIHCDSINPATAAKTPILDWPISASVRSLDVARLKDDVLLAWTSGGKLYAAFSDEPENVFVLGPATANRPVIAPGHEEFVIAWQDADAQTRVTSLDRQSTPKSLALNGVTYRSIGGFVATVPGFLLAFRYENAQQIAVIEPDLSAWSLVEGSSNWRQLSDYAAVDIQDAETGKIVWQTAESLIQVK